MGVSLATLTQRTDDSGLLNSIMVGAVHAGLSVGGSGRGGGGRLEPALLASLGWSLAGTSLAS